MIPIRSVKNLADEWGFKNIRTFFAGIGYCDLPSKISRIDCNDIRDKVFKIIRQSLQNSDSKIDKISNPLWLASDLAENNLCLEKFTLYIVNTLIAKDLIEKNRIDCILCDDDEQVWIYANLLKKNGVKVSPFFFKRNILRKYLGLFKEKIKYTLLSLLKNSYLLFTQSSLSKKNNKSNIIVINWFDENAPKKEKILNDDRYFGNLLGMLSKKTKISIIAKPTDLSFNLFRKIAKQKTESYILINEFSSLIHIIKAFFVSFGVLKFSNTKFYLEGMDFSFLWKVSCFKDALKHRIPLALETFYATKKILKKLGHATTKVLYPFENQPWEKMINLACKERNNTQVYAYQHFPIAKNYLTCYPSQNIIESDLFPYILTSDRYWANCLNSVGCKKHSTLGNFRFQVIEQNSNIKPKSFLNRLEKKAALCACSIQFEDSIELIAKTIEILKLLDKEFSLRLKVNVNFHPLMPKNQIDFIQQSFSKDQNFINWSLKKADDLLQDAFLVFYNSNSICFNAAALGIPSVYIFSDTQINLDRISEISISGTSLEAIAKEIAKLCKDSNLYAQKCGDFYKFFKKYYIPPNFERFEELLIRRNT